MQVCRGGDEISFTNMGLVAEMVLAQVCVRLVSSFVGRLAPGPKSDTCLYELFSSQRPRKSPPAVVP